jgi:hypothetical protein
VNPVRRLVHTAVLLALVVAPVAAVGGAIAYDRAGLGTGVAPQSAPLHLDQAPPGVDVHEALTTEAHYRKAGLRQPARQARLRSDGSAAVAAPAGSPALPVLAEHVEPSCTGTGNDGNRVQVVYAREPDMRDRLAEVAPLIRNEVAGVDDVFAVSADATGGGRRVRWVHSGCEPVIMPVVVRDRSLGSDLDATFSALRAAGLRDPDRKYLVFSEGSSICGVGEMYLDPSRDGNLNDNPDPGPGEGRVDGMLTRVDQACWATPGFHSVAAHELVHTLGGVLEEAPHPSAYGHCTDEADLMCYDDDGSGPTVMREVCPPEEEQLLDCRKDDYFSTAPEPDSFLAVSWNTADSSFLDTVPSLDLADRPDTAFSVRTSGSDPVTVTGTLVDAGGAPIGDAPVVVRTRLFGASSWTTTSRRTSASGTVAYAVRPSAAVHVRFTYAGTPERDASSTDPVLVRMSTRMGASAAIGSTTTLTGVLANGVTRRAVPSGMPVTLRVRWNGSSTWSTVTTGLRTDSAGRVHHRFTTSRAGTFVFSHAGTAATAPSTSPSVLVRVPTKLSMSVRSGRPNTLTGRLTSWAGTPLKATAVRLQYRYAGTGTWSTSPTTFRTSSSGVVTVRVQPRRAAYYRWVYAGSSTSYLPATSASGSVRY